MGKTRNIYQNNLSKTLVSLQKDLENEKITQDEFNVLLGLLIKVELNNFIKNKIKQLDIEEDNKLTYIGYAGTRTFNQAI